MAKKSPSENPPQDVDAVITEALSDEEHLELTLESLQRFIKPALVLVVLVLLGTVGIGVYRNYERTNEISAGKRLFAARDNSGLQEVVDNFPDTSHAMTARLLQARRFYQDGVFDKALAKYDEVLALAGGEPYGPPATMGRLYALEALGRLDEAFEGFDAFATQHAGHYYELDAQRGAARCLLQLGRLDESEARYEAYREANPTHPSLGIVEAQLATIKRRR